MSEDASLLYYYHRGHQGFHKGHQFKNEGGFALTIANLVQHFVYIVVFLITKDSRVCEKGTI